MSGSRQRPGPDEGALARARRFLGRVIDTVRGSERPSDLPPPPDARAGSAPRSSASGGELLEGPSAAEREREPTPAPSVDERVVEEPTADVLPAAGDPARALLADASWSGLRAEHEEGRTLLAWRDLDAEADTLRTVEIHCDFGALDAAPRVVVRDHPASGVIGARTLEGDAARIVVSLGRLREGRFVSAVHATVR